MNLLQKLFSTRNHINFFITQRAHHVWFGKYISRLSIEDNHTPGSLLLWQYPESSIHKSDLLNLISCELDLTSTPFHDKTMITYEIELPPSGRKVGFNVLDDEDFKSPSITDTTPNSPSIRHLTAQDKRNVLIIAINGLEPITAQGALDELKHHKNPRGKPKDKIRICRRKSYQITYLEDICSRFDQVRPVVSHIELRLPKKTSTPKNIGEGLKGSLKKLRKEALFVKHDKNKNIRLLLDTTPVKSLPEGTKFLCSLITTSIKEGDFSDAWKFVARNCAYVESLPTWGNGRRIDTFSLLREKETDNRRMETNRPNRLSWYQRR